MKVLGGAHVYRPASMATSHSASSRRGISSI